MFLVIFIFVALGFSKPSFLPFSGKKQRSFMKERLANQKDNMLEQVSELVFQKPCAGLDKVEELKIILERKDKKEALDYCTKLLTVDPYNYSIWRLRARYRGSLQGKIDDLSQAIRWSRTNEHVYWERALAYYEQGDISSCLKDLDVIRRMNAYVELEFLLRGHCYFVLKQYQEAKKCYQKQLNTGVFEYEALFFLGSICIVLREWEEGARVFLNLLRHKPADCQSLYNYAYCLLKLKKWKESRYNLLKVVEQRPSFFHAWYHLAIVESILGFYEDSLKHINWLLTQELSTSLLQSATLLKAQVLLVQGHISKSLSLFIQVGVDRHWKVAFHRMLGLWLSGQWEKAYCLLKDKVYPSSVIELYFFRGYICEKLGFLEEAKQNYFQYLKNSQVVYQCRGNEIMSTYQLDGLDMRQVMEAKVLKRYCSILWKQENYSLYLKYALEVETSASYEEKPLLLFRRAYCLSQSQRSEHLLSAIPLFVECINWHYLPSVCHYNLGNIYYRLGDYTNSLSYYTAAIRLDPDFSEAYYNRSQVYMFLGDKAQAQSDRATAQRLKRAVD